MKKQFLTSKKQKKLIRKSKRDTSRSGYNEDQPTSRPGKKKI